MIFTAIGQSVKEPAAKIIQIPLVLQSYNDVFKLLLYVVVSLRSEFDFQLQVCVKESSDTKLIEWFKGLVDQFELSVKWIFAVKNFEIDPQLAIAVFQDDSAEMVLQKLKTADLKNVMIFHASLQASVFSESLTQKALHVFQSESQRKVFLQNNPQVQRTLLVLQSVPVSLVREVDSQKDEVLIYYGGLDQDSEISVLLEAFDLVYATRPQIKLHVIGSGVARQTLESWIEERDLFKAIEFYHEVEWSAASLNVVGLLHAHHNPSLSCFALEALACGLPCLITFTDEAERLFGKDAEQLIPTGNQFYWAQKMARLVDDCDYRKELAQKSLSAFQNHFDWKKMKASYQTVFNLLEVE